MILLNHFLKRYTVRKPGDLGQVHSVSELGTLPKDTVLHILDYMSPNAQPQVVPDLDNPLLQLSPTKKHLLLNTSFHNHSPQLVEAEPDKFRPPVGSITSQISEFRKQTRGLVRFAGSPADLLASASIQPVICHNGLRKYRTRGRLAYYRLFNHILAEVINTTVTRPDLHHIIALEWSHIQYDRGKFIKTYKQHTTTSLAYQDEPTYLFLCHLLSWLSPNSDSSFMNSLPEEHEANITFALFRGNSVVFYNLKQLRELVQGNVQLINKMLAQLNMMTSVSPMVDLPTSIRNTPSEVNEEEPDDNQPTAVLGVASSTKGQYERSEETSSEVEEGIADDIQLLNDAAEIVVDSMPIKPTPAQVARIEKLSKQYEEVKIDKEGRSLKELLHVNPDIKIDPGTLDVLAGTISDESMLQARSVTFDRAYMENLHEVHMAKTLTAFNTQGMFVTGVNYNDEINEFTRMRHYSVQYEDTNHKRSTIKFSLPIVDEDGTCLVNGTQKSLKKQRVNNPIVKSGPTRVSLSTYFNKTLVERVGSMSHNFAAFFVKHANMAGGDIEFGRGQEVASDVVLPFEYADLRGRMRSVKFDGSEDKRGKTYWNFDYVDRFKGIKEEKRSFLETQEEQHGIYIGTTGKNLCFMSADGTLAILSPEGAIIRSSTLLDEVSDIGTNKVPPHSEYVELKILNAKIPLGMILSYRFGFLASLDYMNVDYQVLEKGQRVPGPTSSIRLRFKDKTVVIPRTPAKAFLIFAGMDIYDLRNIFLEEMEEKDVYYELMSQKKLSTNYLKGVDSFFDMFIDPITRDILRMMGEPTNVRDLLIRATELLLTTDFEPAGSTKNCRIRSYERMSGILYNEMARALATYKNKSVGARDKFSINPQAIEKRILTDQLMNNVDVINPIHEVKNTATISHLGDGGRTEQTFMVPDRKFTKDSVGVISEATVDSGKVGIIRQLSVDPELDNLMGLSEGGDPNTVSPTNLLSVTGLLFPGATQDDAKRCNFVSIQSSHVVGTKESDVCRIGTGMERVMAQRSSPPFSYVAKGDGTVTAIDEELGLVKIAYSNGEEEVISIGSNISSNSGGGFYLDQTMQTNGLSVGGHFKRGDVLAYNPRFYQPDPFSKQVDYKLGTTGTVCFIETSQTLEDSTVISPEISNKLAFAPVMTRDVTLNKDTTVHSCVSVGDTVRSIDSLLSFDEAVTSLDIGGDDVELKDLLQQLNMAMPKAKHTGHIVKIDVFYKCELADMNPSLAAITRKNSRLKNQRSKFSEGTKNNHKCPKPGPLKTIDRIGNANLDMDTVIIRFYIQHETDMGPGSKLIVGPSLKSVAARVMDTPITTEDGTPIDVLMSCRSKEARIVFSPDLCGVVIPVLEKMEEDLLEILESD